ncbi:conserved hypothetical protein [Ricinus communis]|uniref:Uncharacterized protein n=1 Tax=Ricinus communis TaxID=3988 RepID=B9TKB1_RICCO|nr:conserved hypothetical protein [Ricinus communis]
MAAPAIGSGTDRRAMIIGQLPQAAYFAEGATGFDHGRSQVISPPHSIETEHIDGPRAATACYKFAGPWHIHVTTTL